MQKIIRRTETIVITGVVIAVLTILASALSVRAQSEDAALRSIASRCVNAQSKLRVMQQQATDAGTKRSKVYAQADARLWVAIGKLKLGGDKDTSDLEKVHADLMQKTTQYSELNQAYITTLNDMSSQSCKDDPATFQASLATARTQYNDVRTLNAEIRTFFAEDIKTSISAFTSQDEEEATLQDSSEE